MTKEAYYQQAIKWTEKKGFSNIKANHEDYETPSQFSQKGEADAFIPDITGSKTNMKYYVEIAMKDDNMERMKTKWRLLDTLASMKGGKLFLLAPKGHKAFVERTLIEQRLPNTQVIALN